MVKVVLGLFLLMEADQLYVSRNGKLLTSSFVLGRAIGHHPDFESHVMVDDYVEFHQEKISWSSPYVHVNALNGRVRQMDLFRFSHLVFEMKWQDNTANASILIKDSNGMSGEETKVKVDITPEWQE